MKICLLSPNFDAYAALLAKTQLLSLFGEDRSVKVAVWAALLGLVLIPSARAASFDCAKASTFVEKAICTDKQLSSLDDQPAGLYKAARATM